ncbi:MAG: cobalt ECF transporter T component CbiQ [Desulfuromonadaceae bacterium]|nr:cobalt ECF transporter T component CbiQ [Desulfuromonadaceae bacterium]
MLIEQSAYTNRWRRVSPAAKGIFSLCGMIAAYAATAPATACGVAAILCAVTVLGAGIPLGRYLRIAAPALFFLAASALSLAVSLKIGNTVSALSLHLSRAELEPIAHVCGRSLGGLTALLFLALTTPLSDIISLLRRCKLPDTLLDLMTLSYRTLFVFSEAVHETITAQSARMGYATITLSLRSLGGMVANLSVQVWHRSQALHLAALARNNDGALRFLEPEHPDAPRTIPLAVISGFLLVFLAAFLP